VTGKDAEFSRKIIAWQRHHGRHGLPWQGSRDPYRVWVSEIMLQQTQVGAVTGYYQRFMDRFPDVVALAGASENDVLRLWSGLGYYARARNLHKAARAIASSPGAGFPRTAAEIELLPGIGRSTAAAIAAFCFGERAAILDGNVKRVLARRFGVEGFPGAAKVEADLWTLADRLLPNGAAPEDIEAYTQGLMDLGATVCTRGAPECGKCPVSAECVARLTKRTAELPAPRAKKAYPTREAAWLLLRYRGQTVMERRPSPGIWGGLWVFPEFGGGDPARHCLAEFGCVLSSHTELPVLAHGFTHFRLEIRPIVCEVAMRERRAESPGRAWFPLKGAASEAVPVPVRKLLALI
jgi:A/G-specific adenine glycosylase